MRQSIDLRMSTGSVANTTRTDAGSENTTSPPQRDNEPRHVVDVGVHGEPQARSAGQHHLEQLRTQLRRDSYLHRLRLPGRLASAPVHSRLQRAQPQPALPRELLLRQPTRLERFDAPEPLLLPHRLRHARQGPRRRLLTQRPSPRRLPDGYPRRKAASAKSKSLATSATDLPYSSTRFTAPALNSGLKLRRCPLFFSRSVPPPHRRCPGKRTKPSVSHHALARF